MPEFLDRLDRLAEGFGQRDPHQAGRDSDARRAAQELQQGPAAGGIQPVEPLRQLLRLFGAAQSVKRADDLAKTGNGFSRRISFPDQRQRLGRVADIVARQAEELGIEVAAGEFAENPAQREGQRQSVAEGGQGIAAIGIGCGPEVVAKQALLAQARGRVDETVEECREVLHSASSSRPTSASARALSPICVTA